MIKIEVRKPRFVKARVCIKIAEEVVCTLRSHKIVLEPLSDTKGHLMDGRPVEKIGDNWYCIAK